MDIHSKEIRSYNMSRVRSKNTKPEEIVRKYLFSQGFRFRKNVKSLPGCPDIVLPKYKAVVFINGCFWHVHENCPKFKWPSTNVEFWKNKLNGNRERDLQNNIHLKSLGWKVITIWTCEITKGCRENRLNQLCFEIKGNSHLKSDI
ncbi:MAG: very short patch repair endonuclease [Ethanoligenens sp.]